MRCHKSHHVPLSLLRYGKEAIRIVIAAVPSVTVTRGVGGSQRRPQTSPQSPGAACLLADVAKFTPPPPSIPSTSRWDSVTLPRPSAHRVMWKPATSLCGWQCPSRPCIQHSVPLIPLVPSQLPDRSLTCSLSLCGRPSSLVLSPSMA